MTTIEVLAAGATDTGNVREDNQDHYFVADLTRSMSVRSCSVDIAPKSRLFGTPLGYLFLVADGMGGHQAGSQASLIAIQYLVNSVLNSIRWLVRVESSAEAFFQEELKTMMENAHRALLAKAKQVGFEGMGTTMTMAYVAWPKAFIVHAGDTRCYLLRDQQLQRITRDHTVASQMIQNGQLDPQDLETSPWSNVLVNALGAGATNVVADIYRLDLQDQDILLLCSDGLNKHVQDEQIAQILLQNLAPQRVCDELIQMAKQAGGSDNITVVVGKFVESQTLGHSMQIIAAKPTSERVVQDVLLSPGEEDTSEMETSDHIESDR